MKYETKRSGVTIRQLASMSADDRSAALAPLRKQQVMWIYTGNLPYPFNGISHETMGKCAAVVEMVGFKMIPVFEKQADSELVLRRCAGGDVWLVDFLEESEEETR